MMTSSMLMSASEISLAIRARTPFVFIAFSSMLMLSSLRSSSIFSMFLRAISAITLFSSDWSKTILVFLLPRAIRI